MTIKVYNLETGENFKLSEDIVEIGMILKKELKKRNWKSSDCKVEVLEYE